VLDSMALRQLQGAIDDLIACGELPTSACT
jgi:hypothetical protein